MRYRMSMILPLLAMALTAGASPAMADPVPIPAPSVVEAGASTFTAHTVRMESTMQVQNTAQGKQVVYDVSSGQRLERWPVDAKAMIAAGTHSYEPQGRKSAVDDSNSNATTEQPFDPVLTPATDLAVTSSEPGHAEGIPVTGAITDVSPLPSAEPANPENPGASVVPSAGEAAGTSDPSGGVNATAVAPPWGTGLPETTPLGVPAVHARAGDATSAGTGASAPTRTEAKPKSKSAS